MEERRKVIRRRADRELFELIEKKTGMKPYQLLRQRKRRQVIRHTCKATLVVDNRKLLDIESEHVPPTEDSETGEGISGLFDGDGLSNVPDAEGATDLAKIDLKTRVLDLSEGGASLFTTYNVNPGQRGRLEVKLFDGSTIQSTVEIRWSKRKEVKGGYVLGVQFVDLDAVNKKLLRAFLKELDANLGML